MKHISLVILLLMPLTLNGKELEYKLNSFNCEKFEGNHNAISNCGVYMTVNVSEKWESVMCYGQVVMHYSKDNKQYKNEYGFLQRNREEEGKSHEPESKMEFIASVNFQEAWNIQEAELLWVKCETFKLPKARL